MEGINQEPAKEPEYDLDLLREKAVAAAWCLHGRMKARAAGEPFSSDAALHDFSRYCIPNIILLALDRLAQATLLLEAAKGGVSDPALRKRIDAYLTGVLTMADLTRAWPPYAAYLKEQTAEAMKSGEVH